MDYLKVPNKFNNELLLNTPNRNEILKMGPPADSHCNILGKGTYGTVFKATFRGKSVAVKIVCNRDCKNAQTMRSEANILGWKHRNIVRILKIESTPSYGIIIMERFSSECLQSILDAIDLPLRHRVIITKDIINALIYCHKNDLLHLDVKPQNVLVCFNNQDEGLKLSQKDYNRNYLCKLCDFGSSLKISNEREYTPSHRIKGTVRYMAPEALCEDSVSAAADIYSLGIMMWQLISRQLPYEAIESNDVVIYQVVKRNLRPDSNLAQLLQVPLNRHKMRSESVHHHCTDYASEITFHSMESLRQYIKSKSRSPRRNVREASALNGKSLDKKTVKCRLFQSVHRNISKDIVVRNLYKDFDKCNYSKKQTLEEKLKLFEECFKMDVVKNSLNEKTYSELYSCCWKPEPEKRIKAIELRDKLKLLMLT